jgi:hypothetical protein
MLARVGAGAAVRGAEGAVVTTPQALSQYDVENQLGENPNVASIFATLGMGAGLGGVIGGVAGFRARSPITVEADQMAKQTAVNQLATGKSVHVDEILQNGYNQARDIETPPSLAEMENTRTQLQSSLDTTNDSLTQEQQNLNDLLSKENSSEIATANSVNSDNLPDRLSSIFQKPEALRDTNDTALLESLPKTDEVSSLTQSLQKPISLRDDADQNIISQFQNGKESDLIQDRIKQNQDTITQLDRQIDQTPLSQVRVLKKLSDQQSELRNSNVIAQQRLDEINKLNNEPQAIKESRQRLTELNNQKSQLQNSLYQHQISMLMTKDAVPDMQGQQIKNASEYMQNYKSDSAYSQPDEERLTNELKGIPDDPYKDATPEKEQVRSLQQQDILDDEDKANLENANSLDQQYSIFEKAFKATINCLKST